MSVKLLNALDPEGEYLKFYTELDITVEVNAKVFIVGGNYDNTVYTDATHPLYNPYHPFAAGYTVLSIDNTINSNAITLNIKFSESRFSSGGIESFIFNPKPVYKTEEELLFDPNQVREAYLTTTYFKRGEFNGGSFQNGVFGEYNIQGAASTKPYQRQYFVDLLKLKYLTLDVEKYQELSNKAYSGFENPVPNPDNKAIFNNNYFNNPADFSGIFLGGNWNWGEFKSRTAVNKSGKRQLLEGTTKRMEAFSDNNAGNGYNLLVSGNVGRIYTSPAPMRVVVSPGPRILELGTTPFELLAAVEAGFTVQIKLHSTLNNKVLEVESLTQVGSQYQVLVKEQVRYQTGSTEKVFQQRLFAEDIITHIDVLIRDSDTKKNRFNTGKILGADWFGGVVENGSFLGGDWHGGEFRKGTIGSSYQRTTWYDGIMNGTKEATFAQDLRWLDGQWFDGNWRGDVSIGIRDLKIKSGKIELRIDSAYKHLIQLGEPLFISYLKQSFNNAYFDNYTDLPNSKILNFQQFTVSDIVDDNTHYNQVTLVVDGNVEAINNVNLKYAKVSQSNFAKGVWHDGAWDSGLRQVQGVRVTSPVVVDVAQRLLTLEVGELHTLHVGDYVQVSNLQWKFLVEGELVQSMAFDNRHYFKTTDELLTIKSVNPLTKTLVLEFPVITVSSDVAAFSYELVDIVAVETENSFTEIFNALWLNGEFRAGVWNGGLWNNGHLKNNLYFDLVNTQPQSIWQSGYWRTGIFEKGAFLSGVWEYGTWRDGIMTNLHGSTAVNQTSGWNAGDSVWLNGVFESGKWKAGLWKNGRMNNGTVLNGSIENINWISGTYHNGLGLYDINANANRSGKFSDEKNQYDSLSAPSLIYIDGDGWVQLDQPSFYQKDYNVIFQDLDTHKNPFANQMFKVQERDQYGTRLRIDYSSAGSDNPMMQLAEFLSKSPLLATDKMMGVCEVAKTNASHRVWLLDAGHNRILDVDLVTNKVDVLGKILNESAKDIYDFSDLKAIACANNASARFVYVLDGNSVRLLSVNKNVTGDERTMFTLTPVLADGETLLDIWVASESSSSMETVFALSSTGKLYYTAQGWTGFKSLTFPVTGTVSRMAATKSADSSTIHLFLGYNDGLEQLKHYILDFTLSDNEYLFRVENLTLEGMSAVVGVNPVKTLAAAFIGDSINLWLSVVENGLDRIYLFEYKQYFTNSANNVTLLNGGNAVDYPVASIKMGWANQYLLIIGDDAAGNPVHLVSAELNKTNTGFANQKSSFKLLNIYQNLDKDATLATRKYNYFYYDSSQSPVLNRLISVRDGQLPLYNPVTGVDTLGSSDELVRMINGGSEAEMFSIVRRSGTYLIRRSVFDTADAQSTYYYLDTAIRIHDISYSRNTLFIAADYADNKTRLVSVSTFLASSDIVTIGVAAQKYYTSDFSLTTTLNSKVLVDVVENKEGFLAVLYRANSGFYQMNIDNTSIDFRRLYATSPKFVGIVDIAVCSKNGKFSLFAAYPTKIYRLISDVVALDGFTAFWRWSQFSDSSDNDLVYEGKSITDVYRTVNNDRLVVKNDTKFDVFDSEYVPNKFDVSIQEYVAASPTSGFMLSNQLLLQATVSGSQFTSITETGLGRYKQNGRLSFSSTVDKDSALNNPLALIYAPAFNTSNENYVFFLDNTVDIDSLTNSTKRYIRYYNIDKQTSGIVKPYNLLGDIPFTDLYYSIATKEVYVLREQYVFGQVQSSISKFKWGGGEIYEATDLNTLSNVYGKFALNTIQTMKCAALTNRDGNSVDFVVDIDGPNAADRVSTIVTGTDITNVAFYTLGGVNHIYYTANKVVYLITNTSGSAYAMLDANSWSTPQAIGQYDKVNFIAEFNDSQAQGIIIHDAEQRALSVIQSNSVSQTFNVSDFGFAPTNTFTSNSFVYLYVTNESVGSGMLRQPINGKYIDIRTNNMVHDALGNSAALKKIIAVSDNQAYALFDDKIYKYNFVSKKVSLVSVESLRVQHRSDLEPYPADLSGFRYSPVDIALLSYTEALTGTLKTSLLVTVEILNNGNNTGCYDVFNYNGNSFSKQALEYLYHNNNALSYNGDVSTSRLNAAADGTGGVKYLFNSVIAPKVVSHDDTISILMGASVAAAKLLKVRRAIDSFVVIANTVNSDLVYKVTLPTLLGESQYVRSVALVDASGTTIATTSDVSVGSYLLAGTDILDGSTTQDFVVIFPRDNTSVLSATASYTMTVSFLLSRTAPVLSKPMSDTNPIFDIKPYSLGGVQAYALRNLLEAPVATDLRYERFWSLNKLISRYDISPNVVDATSNEQLSVRYPFLFTVQKQWAIPVGQPDNDVYTTTLGALSEFKNSYSFTSLVKGYRVASGNNKQVLSPYLTSRVLYETYIQDGVNFNTGGSIYSAHVVSTRWKNKLFLGSWDAPFYLDNKVLDKSSVFLSGIFEGVFYDGFMLGGSFRNNSQYPSVVRQGHFRSDYRDINFESGSVNSEFRYDIQDISCVEVGGKSKLRLSVQAMEYQGGQYRNVVADHISKGRVIHLPSLFKASEFTVVEILKTNIDLNRQRTIVLKVELPALYSRELFINQNVFLSTTDYAEYLFGEQLVLDVYSDQSYMYLVIESEFSAFTNGRYIPVVKPKIINNVYKRIEDSVVVEKDGKLLSVVQLDILVPDIFAPGDMAAKYNFVQNYYLSDHVQIMKSGAYAGKIQIPDYLQLFTLSFIKSYKETQIQFTSLAKNLYLSNITSKNNSSLVSIKVDAASPSAFARDIMVSNSYVTTPASRSNDWMENSVFLSGRTDRNWKSGAWLNLDQRGFANGSSTFGSARDPELKQFEGAYVGIENIYFEAGEYLWVELSELLPTVQPGAYICLRGFTGNKSILIGAERSNVFRIVDVNEKMIKISNPFRYFTGTSNEAYFNDFKMDELRLRTQRIALKDVTSDRIELATPEVARDINYGYASVSAWNGGDFYGKFNTIWNAGNFRNGEFNGKWFGSAENYHWQDEVTLVSSVTSTGFTITLDVNAAQVEENDLVYVQLNPVLIDGQLQPILTGFYATVLRNVQTERPEVIYVTDVLMKNGSYNTSLTRYRVNYSETNHANAAIYNYNSNRTNNAVLDHTRMDVETALDENTPLYKALVFDGNTSINTVDLLSVATRETPEFSLDTWFSYDDDVVDALNPLVAFHRSELESKSGFKLFIRARQIWLEYNGDENEGVQEVMLFDAIVTSRWYHLGLFVSGQTLEATLYEQDLAAMQRVSKPFKWVQEAYDICYIGKGLFRAGTSIESYTFKGRIDELRVWSTNMLPYFVTPDLADSWYNRKFANKYIPELIASYSGDNQLDVAALYPEEELYVFLNETVQQDTMLNAKGEVFKYAGKDAILSFDVFMDKPKPGSATYASAAKLLTIIDSVDVTLPTDLVPQTLNYHLELFVLNSAGNTYTLSLRESVSGDMPVPKYTTIALDDTVTLPYWAWTNLILENGAVYTNGQLLATFPTHYRNVLSFTKNTRVVLGAFPLVLDVQDETAAINTVYSASATLRRVSVFENKKNNNDYLTYRIKSAETTSKYAVTSTVLAANTLLENPTPDNIIIPSFKADGSNILVPEIYAAETALYDIRGVLRSNQPLSANRTVIPEVVGDKLVRTDTLATALPQAQWLQGSFTRVNFTGEAVVAVPVTGMAAFSFFGKKMADSSDTVLLHLHKNGFLSFNKETAAKLAQLTLLSNVVGSTGYELFSSADIIQLLHTSLNFTKGGYMEYADRPTEFVVKLFAANEALNTEEGVYNYVALRIDKVNSNILFYNRMIRENNNTYQKYQGLMRSDGKVSTIKDPAFSYYKNPSDSTDFGVGYVGNTAQVTYADNVEYILYVPRYQNNNADKSYIQQIFASQYDALATAGIKLLNRYEGKTSQYFTFATVEDFPITLLPYYYQSLSNVQPYAFATNEPRAYSDAYVAGQSLNAVPRVSFFYDGLFTGNSWYNGVFLSGSIKSDDFVWKYGIKYSGSMSARSFHKRLTAASFISAASNELYDRRALYTKAIMVNRQGEQISGTYVDLAASQYKVALNLKTTNNQRNEPLAVISAKLNTVHSSTGLEQVLASRVIRSTDFVNANEYQLFDFDLTLDKAQKGVEIVVEYVATSFTQLLMDYALITERSRTTDLAQANALHWLGGFHQGSATSSTADLVWYRGSWNGGTWKSGHWFSLDSANQYYDEQSQPNNNWSVWNGGKWMASNSLYALSANPYQFDLQASVWHGGTWNSPVVAGQLYSYEASKFESHVLQDNTLQQLPAVSSAWLGGQWLRGTWNGGIFANGFWHSVSAAKTLTTNTFKYSAAVTISNFDFRKIVFVDSLKGYIVGQSGTILHTMDAGGSWTRQLSNTSRDLNDIAFLDELNGLVVGKNGTILRTTDGGATWFPTIIENVTTDFVAIHFTSVEVGFLVGGTSVYRTTDSGQTWTDISTKVESTGTYVMNGRMSAIAHSPNGNVYLVGESGKGYVSNLGDRWIPLTLPTGIGNLTDVYFPDNNTGIIVGDSGLVLKTNDAQTWTKKESNTRSSIVNLHFIDRFTAYAVANAENVLMETNDAGETWFVSKLEVPVKMTHMTMIDASKQFIVGTGGKLLRSYGEYITEYEAQIGNRYDLSASTWNKGLMLNSVWEGGRVSENDDLMETIFGEVTSQFKLLSSEATNLDFVWNRPYQFKKYDLYNDRIFTKILGKDFFIGYHNGTGQPAEVEVRRVKNQTNADGIASVYWKRGEWGNGLFQFSHWANQDLDSQDITTISSAVEFNPSQFKAGIFYSSYWEGGLWLNKSTSNTYPLTLTKEPVSLFYYSQWEKGYWKTSLFDNGLITDDVNDSAHTANGMFLRSIWSAGIWEGGLNRLSLWRSGVRKDVTMQYKGASIPLLKAANPLDSSLAVALAEGEYPNFDLIGRLSNVNDGEVNALTNTRDNNAQPLVANQKKYVLNRNNTISVFNVYNVLVTTISLDFGELYAEVFNPAGGSNTGENLPAATVTVLRQSGNIMWVGTTAGLWKFDTVTKLSQRVSNLPDQRVTAVFTTPTWVWVGTEGGLYGFKNVGSTNITIKTGNATYGGDSLPTNQITCIHGNDTTLHVGTTSGVWVYQVALGTARMLNSTNFRYQGVNLPSQQITALYTTTDRVWVGTPSGLWLLNNFNNQLIAQLFAQGDNDGINGEQIPSNVITSIAQVGNVMWIGTDYGLWRMIPR